MTKLYDVTIIKYIADQRYALKGHLSLDDVSQAKLNDEEMAQFMFEVEFAVNNDSKIRMHIFEADAE